MTPPAAMSTAELLKRLERHYIPPQPLPGGIFVPEVGLNNGDPRAGRCDAIYVGFTSTSGRHMIGHELKVSRGDWLHELGQPGKADFWHDACHEWYVVAPSTDVVRPEEVPHGWGLLVVNPRSKTRLDRKIKAIPKGSDHAPPWLAVRSLIARMDTLRAVRITAERQELQRKMQEELTNRLDQLRSGGLGRDELRMQHLVKTIQERARADDIWTHADDDLIAAAVIDHLAVKAHAAALHRRLRDAARELPRLTDIITDILRVADNARTVMDSPPLPQEPKA